MEPHSFECGIDGDYREHARDSGWASMGPHSFECGIPAFKLGSDWRFSQLQWGRTHSSAEYFNTQNGAALPFRASMGPHSFECGIYSPSWSGCCEHVVASMGPHSFECGIRRRVTNQLPRREPALQWGRTHSSAEYFGGSADGAAVRPASMGPHSFECGIPSSQVQESRDVLASMGPHSFECGITPLP